MNKVEQVKVYIDQNGFAGTISKCKVPKGHIRWCDDAACGKEAVFELETIDHSIYYACKDHKDETVSMLSNYNDRYLYFYGKEEEDDCKMRNNQIEYLKMLNERIEKQMSINKYTLMNIFISSFLVVLLFESIKYIIHFIMRIIIG